MAHSIVAAIGGEAEQEEPSDAGGQEKTIRVSSLSTPFAIIDERRLIAAIVRGSKMRRCLTSCYDPGNAGS